MMNAKLLISCAFYAGCNVENVSSPLGNCAEKTAINRAVAEGHRKFLAIAVSRYVVTGYPMHANKQ